MNSKIIKAVLALVAGIMVSGISVAGDPLTVARDETLVINSATNVAAVTVHGTLKVTSGNFEVDDGNPVYIDLGPDVGDVGEMIVTNAVIKSVVNSAINVRIGNNGGGDNAKLRLYKTTSKWSYLGPFTLTANASTAADRFESLEIGEGGFYRLSTVENANMKPLVVSFTGEGAQLDKFWSGDFFSPVVGDIVLKSVDGTQITLGGYRGGNSTVVNFFAANPQGYLRTEGAGDVLINTDGGGNTNDRGGFCINSSNVAWGHSGDLLVGLTTATYKNVLKLTADDVLPHGAGTGEVILQCSVTAGGQTTFDVCGTSQRLNGLTANGFSIVTNSSDRVATLEFGSGNTDGLIKNVVTTNSAIRCVKTGSGTLTLKGSALNELSGDEGSIYVATKTHVDTLALTNMSISFAGGDASLLTVKTYKVDPSVTLALPDGEATNCVSLTFPTLTGATATKAGSGFVTYATPYDAHGTELAVRNGVLRLGGESCSNSFWRLILKKANGNGCTYSFVDGQSKFISVGLGTFALFNEAGIHTVGAASSYKCDTGDDPDNAADIPVAGVTTKNVALTWSKAICIEQHGGTTDPILSGGVSDYRLQYLIQNTNIFSNRYDHPCTSADAKATVFTYTTGIMYDGAALDPEDSATWEVVTWRNNTSWPKSHVSYALRRMLNWTRSTDPYLTDWELQSSPSGQPGTWVTMDERSNQRWWASDEPGSSGLDPQCQYTYNNHIPYLFKSLNADWRFTTFGAVSVAAGATLDLSELRTENIAFNGLRVDLAAGAGTITHFAAAANGTLYLTNASDFIRADGKLPTNLLLPLTFGTILSAANLDSWSIVVDGVSSSQSSVCVKNGKLCVQTPRGFSCVIR